MKFAKPQFNYQIPEEESSKKEEVVLVFDSIASAIKFLADGILEIQNANSEVKQEVTEVRIQELEELKNSFQTVFKLYGELTAPHIKGKIEQILAEKEKHQEANNE